MQPVALLDPCRQFEFLTPASVGANANALRKLKISTDIMMQSSIIKNHLGNSKYDYINFFGH